MQGFLDLWSRLSRNPKFWLLVGVGIVLGIALAGPLRWLFDYETLVTIIRSWGPWAVVLFVSMFALSTVVGLPATFFPIAGGAIFGLVWGSVWALTGATVGAMGAFWLARYLLHDWADRKFGNHKYVTKFNQAVQANPISFVLAVRLAPFSPFSFINFLFGLTSIDTWSYGFGTFVGLIPSIILYTWFGVAGDQLAVSGNPIPIILVSLGLVLLSVLPILWKQLQGRKHQSGPNL